MPIAKQLFLVADESAADRERVKRFVAARYPHFICIEAATGDACVAALRQQKVELAFVSHAFSDMMGMDVLQRVRDNKRKCLLIFTSDYLSQDICERAQELGAYDCVAKPFRDDDIDRILKRLSVQYDYYSALVVDDTDPHRRLLFKTLQDSQFNISPSEAQNVDLAISLCRSIPYHFMFLDEELSGRRGLDQVNAIKRQQRYCRIILMTEDENEALVEEAKEAGLSGILKKPFLSRDINRIIHLLLGLELPNLLREDVLEQLPVYDPNVIMI